MKAMFKEFKEFMMKGDVLDMAVGIREFDTCEL